MSQYTEYPVDSPPEEPRNDKLLSLSIMLNLRFNTINQPRQLQYCLLTRVNATVMATALDMLARRRGILQCLVNIDPAEASSFPSSVDELATCTLTHFPCLPWNITAPKSRSTCKRLTERPSDNIHGFSHYMCLIKRSLGE